MTMSCRQCSSTSWKSVGWIEYFS